jgi:hypothetical protein
VIRNVVIHIANEQPLLADLYDMPASGDVSLLCTNVRMLDGKKPVFVDRSNSVFVFPYLTIRFLEIMAGAATGYETGPDDSLVAASNGAEADAEPDVDLELDEDFLRRIKEV